MSREEKISKQVSWVLRYGAVQEGLRIDENGYINCGDLVRGLDFFLFLHVLGMGAFCPRAFAFTLCSFCFYTALDQFRIPNLVVFSIVP